MNGLHMAARLGLLFLLVSGVSFQALGLEPTTQLADYGRQSWVMENGLPQNSVHALVQTQDGFIWLGTEAGLVRFDGNSFLVLDQNSKPAIPSGDIRCLLAGNDGSLWVGTSEGLARWKDGAVALFGANSGAPQGAVTGLSTTSDGAVEVFSVQGAKEFAGNVWTEIKGPGSAPKTGSILLDPVNGGTGGPDGAKSTVTLQSEKGRLTLAAGKDVPGSRVQAALEDSEGSVWIGTNNGLVRWTHQKIEKLPVTDPLANASILSLLEDREGNLWIGTETGGLHILRDERFRRIGMHEGLSSDAITTVVEGSDGALWAGTNGGGLNAITRGSTLAVKSYSVANGLLSDVILSLAAGRDGDLWVGTPDGLNRIHHGKVDSFTSAEGFPDDFVRSLMVDTDGSLWIATRRGLTHWLHAPDGSQMQTYTEANGLGSDLVGAMARDSNGDLWIATLAGLSRLHGGKITNFTMADGLSSNVITALLPQPGGILLVGTQDHGWVRWDGQKFLSVRDAKLAATSIHAILDDGGKHLWFATANGIARCDCTMTAECAHWVEFGPADGLRSRETATNSHPSAWRSQDGHLWFATPKGLAEVDPSHFPVNAIPPPVAVERFAVDDVDALQTAAGSIRVEAGHNHFEFDYAGLSFIAPQKVRYRYMLEGFDRGWTDAGTRRVAYYTNIPPGHYTFRVQAANNDGLWNTQGTSLQFELRPHFYRTLWFYVLLALTAAALIVLALRRRLLLAEREFKAVLGERNRIAREIHDTLAQGYVGISVQLEVLAELLRLNKTDAATKQLDTTRNHVREGLAEARQSIWALRSQDSAEKTLPVILRRTTENAGGHGLDASFSVFGAYRPLSPGTEREILRVAQEAIHNVKKHADATNLVVRLDYGPAEIALEVRDDGKGFAISKGSEAQPGHYGLTGMYERAATIHGTLEVTSDPGTGTTVRLHAPAPRDARE